MQKEKSNKIKVAIGLAVVMIVLVSGCTQPEKSTVQTTNQTEIKSDTQATTIEEDTSETLDEISDSIKGIQDNLAES
ncbi:MAG: hypothetical protein HY512_01670 [Candidatus Aenigmarchaeota archaeon]|nr:hypothetical protein [Candidatus Aenigmarchaeota archaeon]